MLSLFLNTLCTNVFIIASSISSVISSDSKLLCVRCLMLAYRSVWQKVAGESSLYQLPSIFLSRTSNQRLNIKRLCVVPTFKMAEVNWFFALATFSHSFNWFNEYFLFQDIVKHSVHTLVFRSLKRSHDMFLHDNALPLKRDQKR